MQNTPAATTPPLEPAIVAIFGISGDLAQRYLLPALYRLFKENLLPEQTEIVGISRRLLDMDEIFQDLARHLQDNDETPDIPTLQRMREKSRPYQLNMDDPAAYAQLRNSLDAIEAAQGVCMNRLYYLSIPPSAYRNVIRHMGEAGLDESCPHDSAQSRLLLEKPLGADLSSAEELIQTIAASFDESQVFRIDHYLAKETVQNILTFRFENPLFEAVWNRKHIARIDIVASEKIGIEGRANFYEGQGALRDFIQNHLLQLLALATMDRPAKLDSDHIHDAKLQLLQAIRPITSTDLADSSTPVQARRGQYAGYRDEVGNPESFVETFAAITTFVDTPRWQGVPITIRTGKAMANKQTSITVTFANAAQTTAENTIEFRIAPNEGIAVHLTAKKPGFEHELQPVLMDFTYAGNFRDYQGAQPNAYERVLLDAVRGDRTLFATSDEALAAWRVVDDIVHAWQQSGEGLQTYQPGTPIDEL